MINKTKDLLLNRLFIRYALIGVTGVTLDVLSYIIFLKIGIAPVIATILSTSVGITNNFLLNYFFNFKTRDRMLVRYVKFYGVGLTGIFITAALVFILHDVLGLGPLVAKLITIPPVVIIQFLLNKKISFSDSSLRRRLKSLIKRQSNTPV